MSAFYLNRKGFIVGEATSDTYIKKVKKSKHLFKKWNAWGIDKKILEDLVQKGVTSIVIHEIENKIDFMISVKDFIEKGIEGDFGHGVQVFVPISKFLQKTS